MENNFEITIILYSAISIVLIFVFSWFVDIRIKYLVNRIIFVLIALIGISLGYSLLRFRLLIPSIFFSIPSVLVLILASTPRFWKIRSTYKSGYRKISEPLSPIWYPPKSYTISQVALFYHYKNDPAVFSSILYSWLCLGYVGLKMQVSGSGIFTKKEFTIIKQPIYDQADELNKGLMDAFFGVRGKSARLPSSAFYNKCKSFYASLESYTEKQGRYKIDPDNDFDPTNKYGKTSADLTLAGKKLYQEIGGYMLYLDKVERVVLEQQIRENPDYFNNILPRAALFGLETRICGLVSEMIEVPGWYTSHQPFDMGSIKELHFAIQYSAKKPISRSTSGSAFRNKDSSKSSKEGYAGGGGGGGGGGSW